MAMSQEKRVEAVEALIDSEGLADVVIALHLACLEKAEHLRSNWQDESTAKVWERAANALYRAATNASVETVTA